MKLGVDLSVQDELDNLSPKYYYHEQEIEPFSFFANHSNIDSVRIRLWNSPFDEDGNPYGGGTNDLDHFLRLAKRAKKQGMQIILDFHYSDFWVDPSRQTLPKSYKNLKSFQEIKDALYRFTKDTLQVIKDNDIDFVANLYSE